MDGSKNALDRANTIAWLQHGGDNHRCRIVTNAKCLTEGVDVPALDAVLFIEPKRSQIDVVQAVGRVMRRSEGKQYGYVVVPVVVPSGSNLADDAVLSGSDFKQVWNVLKALRSHDDRLDVAINTADLTGRLPVKVITSGICDKCGEAGCDSGDECPARVSVSELVQGRLPFENAIASKLVDVCGDRQYWDRWGKEVARITNTISQHIRSVISQNSDLAERFDEFTEQMEATIGGALPSGDLAVMVAQHVVTMPVFDALFAGSDFADRNPISKALNELRGEFKEQRTGTARGLAASPRQLGSISAAASPNSSVRVNHLGFGRGFGEIHKAHSKARVPQRFRSSDPTAPSSEAPDERAVDAEDEGMILSLAERAARRRIRR